MLRLNEHMAASWLRSQKLENDNVQLLEKLKNARGVANANARHYNDLLASIKKWFGVVRGFCVDEGGKMEALEPLPLFPTRRKLPTALPAESSEASSSSSSSSSSGSSSSTTDHTTIAAALEWTSASASPSVGSSILFPSSSSTRPLISEFALSPLLKPMAPPVGRIRMKPGTGKLGSQTHSETKQKNKEDGKRKRSRDGAEATSMEDEDDALTISTPLRVLCLHTCHDTFVFFPNNETYPLHMRSVDAHPKCQKSCPGWSLLIVVLPAPLTVT